MPDIWQLLVSAVLLAALGAYAWFRWGVPGAVPFAIGCWFAVLWLLGAAVGVAAPDPGVKLAAYVFQASWQLPLVTVMVCFGLEYTRSAHRLTRRQLIFLSIPPLLAGLLALTNSVHHLVWVGLSFDAEGGIQPQLGIAGWLLTIYGWSLLAVNIVLFCWLFVRAPMHRWPVAIILAGQLLSRLLYAASYAGVTVLGQVDRLALLLLTPFAMYAIALFGFRVFGPLPAAHRTAIDQMREGVVFFDARWLVVSLNPAAKRILGLSGRSARGRTIQELLPAFSHLTTVPPGADEAYEVLSLWTDRGVLHFAPRISSLHDHRGTTIGYVLLLLDVTESRRVEARRAEEHQSQATIQERERLAHELHDGVGQVFATVNILGQAIHRLLAKGDVAAADAQVARLVEIAEEADRDIRDSIIGLRVALTPEGFFAALGGYLERCERTYGIHAELVKPATFPEEVFDSSIKTQLLSIVHEALTNVRKHSGAKCVWVIFELEKGSARMVIQDDGRGFDARQQGALSERVGLRGMRERAESVGGSLVVESTPGAGTQIVVTVPANGAGVSRTWSGA